MKLAGSTALVTGANRGLGRHLAEQLIARGATVYAAARNPASVDVPGAIPITLDITDPASVETAARATGNVTVLINNAGSFIGGSFLQSPIEDIRREMETHYFGTLAVTRAFAPQLAAAGTGAVLNVLSVMSWYTSPEMSAYSQQSRRNGRSRMRCVWSSRARAHRSAPCTSATSTPTWLATSKPTKTTPPPLRSSRWMPSKPARSRSWPTT